AHRRDPGIAGQERHRPRVAFRKYKVTIRPIDGDARPGLESLERVATLPCADSDTKLHSLRALRRRCDRVSARHTFRKTEVDPLPRLETEFLVVDCNRQLHH